MQPCVTLDRKTAEKIRNRIYNHCLCVPAITYGKKDCPQEQAQQLFHALRKLDDLNYKLVYAACPQSEGLSLAVYNRMIRAAGFEVQTLD